MKHVVVGGLLVIIIVAAGWLIGFYNKMINKKALVEECWKLLIMQCQKRDELIKEYTELYESGILQTGSADGPGIVQHAYELDELKEKIEKSRGLYNDKTQNYNKWLGEFPNNLAGKILGVQELQPLIIDNISEE